MPQYPLAYLSAANRGKYFEPANAGRSFSGGNQGAVSTALASGPVTAYTGGLVLYNPISSTVNVSINIASCALLSAQTNAAVINVAVGNSPTTAPTGTLTAVAAQPNLVGGSATAQAKLYSSASITLPGTAVPEIVAQVVRTDANAGANASVDLGGNVILGPGSYACFVSTAAGTASSFIGSFSWEEIPVGTTQ